MSYPETLQHYSCPAWKDFPDIELYMDQVISILEKYLSPFSEEEKLVTSTMINNYVKQKIISPPVNKRYTRAHLAHLFMICTLKRFMQLSDICALLRNLEKDRTPEAAYELFRAELNGALGRIFEIGEEEKGAKGALGALKSACAAFGSICHSRLLFLSAKAAWQEEDEITLVIQEEKGKGK